MTNREKQILDLIIENPLISQEEIAERINITRTTVAVHISNLMKQGYILGKGYVTSDTQKISIVGGVNIDIGGKPYTDLVMKDSNPGKVNITLGGVGRNIAHNLSLLNLNTKMFTALGNDLYFEKIKDSCIKNNIDISNAKKVDGGRTPIYLFICDETGNMNVAISDMEICDEIEIPYLRTNLKTIISSPILLIDSNIPKESIEYLCNNVNIPIFIDPVSSKKALKLVNVLDKIHTFKPNLIEAEILSGVKITDDNSLYKAAKALLDKGIKRLFISLGKDGTLACEDGIMLKVKPYKANVVNTTGAGDAFTAGLIYSYINNFDLIKTCKYASACAKIAIESKETINEHSSVSLIEKTVKEKIEIEKIL